MGAGGVKTEGSWRVMLRRRPLVAGKCQRHWSPVAQRVRKGKRNFASSDYCRYVREKAKRGPEGNGAGGKRQSVPIPTRGRSPPWISHSWPSGAADGTEKASPSHVFSSADCANRSSIISCVWVTTGTML
jgi:hypothetical protein